jgi:UDP:flavonoid glycosyltransferase YjiC (YdhE family)
MLVIPWGHDQPDNAHRVTRLGVARTIPRHRYSAATASEALRRLLDDPSYATRADEVGRLVRDEDGASAACDAIETHLAMPSPAR